MGLKIRHLIQNQGVLGVCRLLINPASQELRGIVKIVSFKTTNFWVSQSPHPYGRMKLNLHLNQVL